ncbi:MAG: thiamine pyrophosphate-dependent enzyme [Planctomycetota bacterium]|jgi:2-oxoglutarate ferredoxin oxidoreductase subunit beta
MATKEKTKARHPLTPLLRMDRMPHIWCPGCGVGVATRCFADALDRAGMDTEKVAVVSGIGCSGRVAGYMKVDSYHTTHGRPIPFATGVKLARPDMHVIVFSGDGDLVAIGGNHLIHAARRNIDITVFCLNNFNYGMTGGQGGPTTPKQAVTTTTPYGCFEPPFSIVRLVAACGAPYVSRFTTLDPRRLTQSMTEALNVKGFSFVEIIGPCPELYGRRNKLGGALKMMDFYKANTELEHMASLKRTDIGFQEKFVAGRFVQEDRPSYIESRDKHFSKVLGDKYKKYEYKEE